MRRVLLLLLLTGCAKSVPTPEATPETAPPVTQALPTMIFQDPSRPIIYKDPATAATTTFTKPPNVVAAAVRLTYDRLKVPVTLDDATPMRIGNADFYRSRNFAEKQMSLAGEMWRFHHRRERRDVSHLHVARDHHHSRQSRRLIGRRAPHCKRARYRRRV